MKRSSVLSFIFLGFLFMTAAGLVFTQIAMHERYKAMSEDNRLKIIPLIAPRGTISDRNGNDMVKDELSFNVSVKPIRGKNEEGLIRELSELLVIREDILDKEFSEAKKRPFSYHVVARDIGIDKAIRIAEMGIDHPGLRLDVTSKRRYPQGKSASVFLGYVGFINREEFQSLKPYGFRMDDLVGRAGLERQYDDYLRGKHGGKQVEVDNRGREVRVLGLREPVPGKSLRLTIDLSLQRFCDDLLDGRDGAIVVMSSNTGEIMALSSSPAYDPNAFMDPERRGEVMRVLNDKKHPLLNRAITGAYPAGSVFKLVVAVAALETGAISALTHYNCPGKIVLGSRTFNCWHRGGHGDIEITEAIKGSCNVFFGKAGLALGPDKIAFYASEMGMGDLSGIDLPFEAAGLVPSESWKKKAMKDAWYKGDTLNYSVGQGYLLSTPIQIARMTSVIANGGNLVRPYIVEDIDGISVAVREIVPLNFSEKNLNIVREGMRLAVNDRRGTAMRARQKEIVVAGKTGTAQTSREGDHGWFAGFAPFEKPELTVVVFDEYGGKGGAFPAETAGKIFLKAKELGII
ncbi:MAG: penicillin-binding protein 2 [Candidatus Omnitrophota bacterium]